MAKRSSKPRDLNSSATAIMAESTDPDDEDNDPHGGKDPAAVERGRRGGTKGGKTRAEKLTPEQRSEIVRKAALARWSREP